MSGEENLWEGLGIRETSEELSAAAAATIWIVDDLHAFRATEGSTKISPLAFGVDTVLWTTVANKEGGQWYKGVRKGA